MSKNTTREFTKQQLEKKKEEGLETIVKKYGELVEKSDTLLKKMNGEGEKEVENISHMVEELKGFVEATRDVAEISKLLFATESQIYKDDIMSLSHTSAAVTLRGALNDVRSREREENESGAKKKGEKEKEENEEKEEEEEEKEEEEEEKGEKQKGGSKKNTKKRRRRKKKRRTRKNRKANL